MQHIGNADVLIFDLKPKNKQTRLSSNVLLELGYALAVKPKTKIFITCSNYKNNILPSDLDGWHVGIIPTNGAAIDRSLFNSIINAIVDAFFSKYHACKATPLK